MECLVCNNIIIEESNNLPLIPTLLIDFTLWWSHFKTALLGFSFFFYNYILQSRVIIICLFLQIRWLCKQVPWHLFFIMMQHGDNTFWTAGEFHAAVPRVATGQCWSEAERWCRILTFVLSTEQPLSAASVAADSCYIMWQNTSTLSCI